MSICIGRCMDKIDIEKDKTKNIIINIDNPSYTNISIPFQTILLLVLMVMDAETNNRLHDIWEYFLFKIIITVSSGGDIFCTLLLEAWTRHPDPKRGRS